MASAMMASAGAAFAQAPAAAPAATGTDGSTVGEIVITALKRTSTVMDTPLAITAITGNALANQGVTNITDIAQAVPGLTVVDAGPGSRRVVIRGIEGPGEPTVGTYYDETPVVGSSGTTSDSGSRTPELGMFDIQRVEVLKGPQGTLYGAGSMSGTFRVITNKPDYTFEGEADVTGSSIDHGGSGATGNFMVNVPIIQDKLAARLVLFDSDSPGYVNNTRTNQDNINTYYSSGGRLEVRYQPTDKLTIDGSAYYQRANGQQPMWFPSAGRYDTNVYLSQPLSDNSDLYNLTAHWDLGRVTLTAVTSYYDRYQYTTNDLDGYYHRDLNNPTACANLTNGKATCSPTQMAAFNAEVESILPTDTFQPQSVHDWTNELRLSSNDDSKLKWTVGFYSEQRQTDTVSDQRTGDPTTTQILNPPVVTSERTIHSQLDEYAGFGEASYQVTSKLTVTAGVRGFLYTDQNTGNTTIGLNLLGTTAGSPVTASSSQTGEVYKFNVSYQLTPNNLLYVEAAQGFRPGGVNQVIGLPQAFTPYQSDSLWDYEIGDKWELLNHRLFIDADVYDIEWNNMQVTGTTANGAFSFISNAGAARVTGVEADVTYNPIKGLQIQATGSYQNAELTQNQINADVVGAGRVGNRIPYVPDIQGDFSIEYTHPLTDQFDGYIRADENYMGNSYSSFSQPYQDELPAYSIVNFRAGVQAPRGKWGAYVFVNNALDRLAITWASTSATSGYLPEVISRPPRTYGLNLRYKF